MRPLQGHELPGSVWGRMRAVPAPSQAAWQGQLCSAPPSPRRVCSALSIGHAGPRGFMSAPVPRLPCRCSPPQDVLQQECRCLGQDLLQLLLLLGPERSQDIAGHCHFTLRPPDADSKPGHLLGRKRESWRSLISRAQLRQLGQGDSAASGAVWRGSRPSCFPGGFEYLLQET